MSNTGGSQEHHSYHVQNHPITTILIGLMCLAILVAASAFAFFQYQEYQDNKPTSSFTVQGSSSREIKAGQATLRFSIEQSGQDVEVLNQLVDQNAQEIESYLVSVGISDQDIQINKNSYEDYYYNDTSAENRSWVVTVSVEALLKDLQSVNSNEVYNQITTLGARNIQPLDFKLDNRKEICEELLTEAIANARYKVDARLEALGGEEVVETNFEELSDCDQNGYYPVFYDAAIAESSEGPNAPDILRGSQELQSTINLQVEYR